MDGQNRTLIFGALIAVLLYTHVTVYVVCRWLIDSRTAAIFLKPVLNFWSDQVNLKKFLWLFFFFFPLPACSCLCGGGLAVAPGSKCTVSNSLMHSVMKLASGVAPDNSPIQKLAFSLLANLAMSRECRGLLQKVQAWHTVRSASWTTNTWRH